MADNPLFIMKLGGGVFQKAGFEPSFFFASVPD